MGKGKGGVEFWVAVVKPGRMLFEITGLDEAASHELLVQASRKLPIKCQVVARQELAAGGA
jgi:large subunit ribosomal protein L16